MLAFFDAIEMRRERAAGASSEYDHGGVEEMDETRAEPPHFPDDVAQEERAGLTPQILRWILCLSAPFAQRRARQELLDIPASVIRLIRGLARDEEHVSDLRSKSMVPMVELLPENDPAANARTHRDPEDDLFILACSMDGFRKGKTIAVILEENGETDGVMEEFFQRNPVASRNIRKAENDPVGLFHESGDPTPNAVVSSVFSERIKRTMSSSTREKL